MTTEEPRVVDSGRYGMSDAAKILGVARCTLRRWIYAGRVNVGFRNLNGRMFITGQELKRIWSEQL
jgi:predicted site-specific integrase-resolvase|nr:MAG TPA: helix-turn-helix domain protein [Caudoviricetes sp.]